MMTETEIFFTDSRDMSDVPSGTVDLTVTSPPYPMIEMWDDTFSSLNDDVRSALDAEEGHEAFELMHTELNKTWEEVARVTKPGGTICINIGDATRTVGDRFELYPNHTKIVEFFRQKGFRVLPAVHWRKPTNKASKFMGSGMLPPNAYVTLENEYILVFTKGENRSFRSKSEKRYQSAYFWEERNKWFSDVWTDIRGTLQTLNNGDRRERSAAFPFEIPYRLINMYSVQGDTVLDPFWGTGTTSLAAMAAARNSIGYEIEEAFRQEFEKQLQKLPQMTEEINRERITNHLEFVEKRQDEGNELKYTSEHYDFPVSTKQEKKLQLKGIDDVKEKEENTYKAVHSPFSLDATSSTQKVSATVEGRLS
jgi:DNA modification methylase